MRMQDLRGHKRNPRPASPDTATEVETDHPLCSFQRARGPASGARGSAGHRSAPAIQRYRYNAPKAKWIPAGRRARRTVIRPCPRRGPRSTPPAGPPGPGSCGPGQEETLAGADEIHQRHPRGRPAGSGRPSYGETSPEMRSRLMDWLPQPPITSPSQGGRRTQGARWLLAPANFSAGRARGRSAAAPRAAQPPIGGCAAPSWPAWSAPSAPAPAPAPAAPSSPCSASSPSSAPPSTGASYSAST